MSGYLYILLGLSDNTECEQAVREKMGWGLLGIVFASAAINLVKTMILVGIAYVRERKLKKIKIYAMQDGVLPVSTALFERKPEPPARPLIVEDLAANL